MTSDLTISQAVKAYLDHLRAASSSTHALLPGCSGHLPGDPGRALNGKMGKTPIRHHYLRSGGDIFTLQEMLGHGSLDMVRHYALVAQVDVEQAHRKASPADNWRL